MTLRAPAAGRVTTVLKRPGEVVVAGEAVAMVVRQQTTRVVACVTERDAVDLAEGTRALLWPAGGGEMVKGVAVALGPLVDELPVRCRTNPKLPTWGRSVVIQLDEAAAMVPGQTFDVRFEESGVLPPSGVATAGLGVTMPLVEAAHA